MKKNLIKNLGKLLIFLALCVFLYTQIAPSLSPQKSNISENLRDRTFEPTFSEEGTGFFSDSNGDEIASFRLELAESNNEVQIGMMWRKTMEADMGMLFIMPEEKNQSFWMKNTYLPLDIIYINKKKEVVSIQENAKPMNERPLPSIGPAIFILEIPGGTSSKLGIKPGNKWTWKKF